MLGGQDVKGFTADSLMSYISMVFQNVFLFHDTIENNIRFGNPSATEEEVIEAAKRAQCHEFISALPDGYQTMVGEGGSTLSGGEKQRISITHRLTAVRNADQILVIDHGRVSRKGTHEESIQENGIYQTFWKQRETAAGWTLNR